LCYACRAELEKSKEKFDVIVGDLADPVEGGPCFQLYTKSFYELIVKPETSASSSPRYSLITCQSDGKIADHLHDPIGWTCWCSHSQTSLLIDLQHP
jgi:hypothetical protein